MKSPTLLELPQPPSDKTGWPWTVASVPISGGDNWPLISIVTPSFNQGQFVEETIRSVLLQGYPNLEYFVMDGGSTDESVAIIKKYARWIQGWRSHSDGGQASAINEGLEKSKGEIQAYINSDDVYMPDTFARVATEFSNEALKFVLIAFDGKIFGDCPEFSVIAQPVTAIRPWLFDVASVFQPSCFWSSSVFRELNGFDSTLHFCFDKEFFFRAIFKLHCYRPCAGFLSTAFRLHGTSKTTTWQAQCALETSVLRDRFLAVDYVEKILHAERRELLLARILRVIASSVRQPIQRTKHLILAGLRRPWMFKRRMFWGAIRRAAVGSLGRKRRAL